MGKKIKVDGGQFPSLVAATGHDTTGHTTNIQQHTRYKYAK